MKHLPKKIPLWGVLAGFALTGATVAYTTSLQGTLEARVNRGRLTAQIRAVVLPAAVIKEEATLGFRPAAPGAGPEVVSPRRPGGGAGSLAVAGLPHQAYTVFLPSMVRLRGGHSASHGITITDFTSFPDVNAGLLNPSGQMANGLGATRQGIPIETPSGFYSGDYTLLIAFP